MAQYNILSNVDYNAQRIENACFDADILREISTEKYPALARLLDSYNQRKRHAIESILDYLQYEARNSLYLETIPDKAQTCIPYAQLSKLYHIGPGTLTWTFNFMEATGMIEKFDPSRERGPWMSWLEEEARKYAKETGYKRPAVYYHLPKWNLEIIESAEALASEKPRVKTLLNLIDTVGVKEAQAVYDTDRRIKNCVKEAREILESILAKELTENGYTRPDRLITALRRTRRKFLRDVRPVQLVKDYTRPMCEKYGLRYARPTAEQVERWNLRKRNGEPDLRWIISAE